jgi:amino acid transporter
MTDQSDAGAVRTEPSPGVSTAVREPGHDAGSLRAGALHAHHVMFMVIATAAPMTVILAIVPLAFAFGNGIGTPGMFLVAAITLAFFAVGYTRAVPFVQNAGAFYAYITQGLNGAVGLVAAYTAVICYTSLAAATSGAMAFFSHDTFARLFSIDLPWEAWAAIWLAIVAFFGYRRITVTARVLAVALTAEVLLLLILDVGILADQGVSSLSLQSLAPDNVFSGTVGVAVIFAFTSYIGFESTAVYAEETVEPTRAIPRATYGALAIVGLFYVFTTWCLLAGGGFDAAPGLAAENPGGYVFGMSDSYLSGFWTDVLSVLIVTSFFAVVLAFHNVASRYIYALARDGVLPTPLGRTHPKWGSPYVAGMTQMTFLVLIVAGFAIAGLDPLLTLATAMTGFGAVGLLALMSVTSVAIGTLFWHHGMKGWAYTVCPAIAALGLAAATVLSLTNYSSLTGSTSDVINALPWLHIAIVLIALGVAYWTKKNRPEVYARVGSTRVAD